MIKCIEHFIKYIMEEGIYMSYDVTDYIPLNPTWSHSMARPLGQPQAIKAKVDRVGNRLIATTTSLADRILLGNKQPNLIEVIN